MSEGHATGATGGPASSGTSGGTSGADDVELLSCEMPGGCSNVVEYAGTGRRPKYCYLPVAGVVHNRYNAHRVNQGLLTLPAPGSRGGASAAASGEAPGPRPVSLARASLEAVRDEIATTVAGHQSWMSSTLARVEEVLATATDPDAAVAEVQAAHRESRALIDAAETAAENATTRARTAQTAAAAAAAAQTQAEQTAEDALAERDTATEERGRLAAQLAERDTELETTRARLDETEQARRQVTDDRDQLTEQLGHAHTERDQLAGELAELRDTHAALRAAQQQTQAERDTAHAELAQTRAELTSARDTATALDQRAEVAERDRHAAEQASTELRAELADARARGEDHAQAAADARTTQAVTAAENAALTRQLERDVASERAHGEQRLTDLADRHAEQLTELRAQLGATAATSPAEPTPTTSSSETSPSRRAAAAPNPTRARRRRGPDQTPDPQE